MGLLCFFASLCLVPKVQWPSRLPFSCFSKNSLSFSMLYLLRKDGTKWSGSYSVPWFFTSAIKKFCRISLRSPEPASDSDIVLPHCFTTSQASVPSCWCCLYSCHSFYPSDALVYGHCWDQVSKRWSHSTAGGNKFVVVRPQFYQVQSEHKF